MNEREGLAHHYNVDPNLPEGEFYAAVEAERRKRARAYWAGQKDIPVEQVTDEMVARWAKELFGNEKG